MTLENSKYTLAFGDELRVVVSEVSKTIAGLDIDDSNHEDTAAVCRPIAISILSLVETVLDLIEARRGLSLNILKRSLSEYVIDLALLAYSRNPQYNRRFAHYGVLVKYWMIDKLEHPNLRILAPDFRRSYRKYVLAEFRDTVASILGIEDVGSLPQATISDKDWLRIDEKVRKKWQWHGWSGKNVPARIHLIEQCEEADALIGSYRNQFQAYCSWSHTSPYIIPKYDNESKSWAIKDEASDDSLYADELTALCLVWSTVSAFDCCKGKGTSLGVWDQFTRFVSLSLKLAENMEYIVKSGITRDNEPS